MKVEVWLIALFYFHFKSIFSSFKSFSVRCCTFSYLNIHFLTYFSYITKIEIILDNSQKLKISLKTQIKEHKGNSINFDIGGGSCHSKEGNVCEHITKIGSSVPCVYIHSSLLIDKGLHDGQKS